FGPTPRIAAGAAPLAALEPAGREGRAPAGAGPMPLDSRWDMSWTDRVVGKHRAVFDSPELSEGAALWRACMWRDQHREIYGTEISEMTPVLVLRHGAIALAMGDAYWAQFEVGKKEKLRDPATRKWATANPVRVTAPDMPPRYAAYSLEGLMASGGIVLACSLAFQQVVRAYAREEKLEREAADLRARENLIPGIVLQPSGIFATLRAQEAGCGYILAS